MMLKPQQDPMGQAIIDYYHNGVKDAEINVHTDLADDDVIPVKLLFRSLKDMPRLEQEALKYCYGSVLDAGAGAGSHTLELQKQGFDVKAIDISPGAVQVMQERGVKNVQQIDLFDIKNEHYDTLLLMMNGVGLVANLGGFKRFLSFCDELLNPGGQILFDTSDIEYLYTEEDGSRVHDLKRGYYGEVIFQMTYKQTKGPKFGWLYLDYLTLSDVAYEYGYDVQLIFDDGRFNYLVRLTKIESGNS